MTRFAVVLAVVIYVGVVVLNAWLADDAYITFRTVDNFIHGYGLTWNVDERVQTYTHPLWMFLISLGYWMTGEVYFTAIAISVLLSAASMYLLAFRVARSSWGAIIGVSICIVSKALVDYSTSGLENPLTYLLLVLFVMVYAEEEAGTKARLFRLSLLAGLSTFNRMDTVLLFAPVIAAELNRSKNIRSFGLIALGFAPFALWEVFSLFYYGFPFPNTAYAKLNTHIPSLDLAKQGLRYLANSLRLDPITLSVIALTLLGILIVREDWASPLAIGSVVYLCYVVWIGGDFMTGRFLAAPLFCSVLVLTRYRWCFPSLSVAILSLVAISGLTSPWCPVLASQRRDMSRINLKDESGICDERRWYYPVSGLTRIGEPDIFREHWSAASVRRDAERSLVVLGAIGYAGFTSGPNVHVVDVLALGDPLLARIPSLWRPSWLIGHFERDVPEGYLDTIASGRNEIIDSELAQLYEKLILITRGDLFDPARFQAIIDINLGRYDHLVDVGRYQQSPYAYEDIIDMLSLTEPKEEGSGWLDAGNVAFDETGIMVIVSEPLLSDALEISLDCSDRYEIAFLKDAGFVARSVIGPTSGGGLTRYIVRIPDRATQEGFDMIRVRPLDGDGCYSLGHVRFLQHEIHPFDGIVLQSQSAVDPMTTQMLTGENAVSCPKGLELRLDSGIHAYALYFCVSGSVSYRLSYIKEGITLGHQTILLATEGERQSMVRVPRGIAKYGFDVLRFTPATEDPGFSVSNLSLLPATDYADLRKLREFPEAEVKYEEISSRQEMGTPWADDIQILNERGIRIVLDGIEYASSIEISVDHNDSYEVVFFIGERNLGSIFVAKKQISTGGLRIDTVAVPKEVCGTGYDTINVYPVSGDNNYSLGHIRLIDIP